MGLPVINDVSPNTIVMFTEHYQSRYCGTFTIIDKYKNTKGSKYATRFTIKFDYDGFELYNVDPKEIRNGAVKDPYYPIIYGVACVGMVDHPTIKYRHQYDMWRDMIRRCYKSTSSHYKNYGGKGVYVCDRWLCFEYFLHDLMQMENYNELMLHPTKYQLDKDIIPYSLGITDNKCYCLEYCCIITRFNNMNQQSLDHQDEYTSNYVGVCSHNGGKSYSAKVKKDKITYNCGVYDNEIAAANARNRGVIKFYGRQNTILNDIPYMNYQELTNYLTSINIDDVKNNLTVNMCRIVDKEVQPKKRVMCRIINKEEHNNG